MNIKASIPLLAGLALAAVACSDTSGLGLSGGDGSVAGSGGAGTGGTGGTATGGTGGSGGGGRGGTGGAGIACGAKACGGGERCCYPCIGLCVPANLQCPVFVQDPCPRPDAGAADARVCPDILCAAPPAGCKYVPNPQAPCTCGTLVCGADGGAGDAVSGDICVTFGACYTLEREYVVAVENGRMCALNQPNQCLHKVDGWLGCPSCETWVNTREKADAIRKQYQATGCDRCRRACPAIRCAALVKGACLASQDPGPIAGPPYSPPPMCAEARATLP